MEKKSQIWVIWKLNHTQDCSEIKSHFYISLPITDSESVLRELFLNAWKEKFDKNESKLSRPVWDFITYHQVWRLENNSARWLNDKKIRAEPEIEKKLWKFYISAILETVPSGKLKG